MIEFRLKEKTKSLNQSFRGDWRVRSGVAKRQRNKAMNACPAWTSGPLLHIRITRISRGTLDDDALPAACKHIRDGIASRLRIDDATRLVEWHYEQAKGEAEVVVQIWRAGEKAPPVPIGMPVERRGRNALATTSAGAKLCAVRHNERRAICAPQASCVPSPKRILARCPIGETECDGGEDCIHPPRSKSVAAAKEAEETFAPPAIPEWAQLECSRSPCDCHRPHPRTK